MNIKIRVTGLKTNIDAGKLRSLSIYPNKNTDNVIYIHEDGDYDIAFTEEQTVGSDSVFFVFSAKEPAGEDGYTHYDTPVTIEQLPVNSFPAVKSMIV